MILTSAVRLLVHADCCGALRGVPRDGQRVRVRVPLRGVRVRNDVAELHFDAVNSGVGVRSGKETVRDDFHFPDLTPCTLLLIGAPPVAASLLRFTRDWLDDASVDGRPECEIANTSNPP